MNHNETDISLNENTNNIINNSNNNNKNNNNQSSNKDLSLIANKSIKINSYRETTSTSSQPSSKPSSRPLTPQHQQQQQQQPTGHLGAENVVNSASSLSQSLSQSSSSPPSPTFVTTIGESPAENAIATNEQSTRKPKESVDNVNNHNQHHHHHQISKYMTTNSIDRPSMQIELNVQPSDGDKSVLVESEKSNPELNNKLDHYRSFTKPNMPTPLNSIIKSSTSDKHKSTSTKNGNINNNQVSISSSLPVKESTTVSVSYILDPLNKIDENHSLNSINSKIKDQLKIEYKTTTKTKPKSILISTSLPLPLSSPSTSASTSTSTSTSADNNKLQQHEDKSAPSTIDLDRSLTLEHDKIDTILVPRDFKSNNLNESASSVLNMYSTWCNTDSVNEKLKKIHIKSKSRPEKSHTKKKVSPRSPFKYQ